MSARNSQGSPAPAASEVENRSHSWNNLDGSQESDTEERVRVEDEEYLEEKEGTEEEAIQHREEMIDDRIRRWDPRIFTWNRAEYDELPFRGTIDLCYHFNMTDDASSLSSGANTTILSCSTLVSPKYIYESPDSIGQASNNAIEATQFAIVSRSRPSDPGLVSPNPPSLDSYPSQYPCLHPYCGYISSSAHNLKRHIAAHFPPDKVELLDCKYEWCGRTGAYGFKREDHRKEHYRKVHMIESEYPKTGKGERSGRRSRT